MLFSAFVFKGICECDWKSDSFKDLYVKRIHPQVSGHNQKISPSGLETYLVMEIYFRNTLKSALWCIFFSVKGVEGCFNMVYEIFLIVKRVWNCQKVLIQKLWKVGVRMCVHLPRSFIFWDKNSSTDYTVSLHHKVLKWGNWHLHWVSVMTIVMLMVVMSMVILIVVMSVTVMGILWTCLHFCLVLKQAADIGEDGKGNDGGKSDQRGAPRYWHLRPGTAIACENGQRWREEIMDKGR